MSKAIIFYRADSYPIELTVTDLNGVPIDVTGCSFKLTVNSSKIPTDETSQIFQVVGVLDFVPSTGKVYFTPSTANTNQPPAKYYYDIQMTSPNGNIRTLVKDEFKITQDITK